MTLYGRMVHHRGHANVFHVGTALVPAQGEKAPDGLTMKASGLQICECKSTFAPNPHR